MTDFPFSLSLLPHREITFQGLGPRKIEFLKETIQTIGTWGFNPSGGWFQLIRNLEDGTLKDVVLTSKSGMIRFQAKEVDSELKVRYKYTWWGKYPKTIKEKLVSYVGLLLPTAIATIMTVPLIFMGLSIFLQYGAKGLLLWCCVASICWVPFLYVEYLTYRMYKKIDNFILEKAQSFGGEKIASSWRGIISWK